MIKRMPALRVIQGGKPEPRFAATFLGGPRKGEADHYTKCPQCHAMVDERDLGEVMRHLDPHSTPPLPGKSI